MAANLSSCPGDNIEGLTRLPGLADSVMQIDFERELQQLRQEDSWQRELDGVPRRSQNIQIYELF